MRTCPTPRLLNQRTGDSHYHWTKKWGAGHKKWGAGQRPPFSLPLRPPFSLLRAEGISLRRIADRINADGHTTRRGKSWNPMQVRRVLGRAGALGLKNSMTEGGWLARLPLVFSLPTIDASNNHSRPVHRVSSLGQAILSPISDLSLSVFHSLPASLPSRFSSSPAQDGGLRYV